MRVCQAVDFGKPAPLELCGPGGQIWRGSESEAAFPKPCAKPTGKCNSSANGATASPGKHRKLYLLHGFAREDEVAEILRIAQTSLEYNVDNDRVDQRPAYERYVAQAGQYLHEEIEVVLRPIVEHRLLPYVRRRYRAPQAVLCSALLRRYLPDERRTLPTHLDGHAFCTAVLGLNAGEFEGGLYVQPAPALKERRFVHLEQGDLALHQYDLPHGVRVLGGRRYSLILWIKDCVQSCVANDTPWYSSGAAVGDPDAMTALAQRLDRGMGTEGVESDPQKAAKLFKKAAELGHVDAQTQLGAYYEAGRGGLPRDGDKAVHWWRLAADAGDSTAQRCLALAYAGECCDLPRDEALAIRWMRRAAEQEDADAMYWLGVCYAEGIGTAVDEGESLRWTRSAAEMAHPDAQSAMGAAYLLGGEGVEQQVDVAAQWFTKSAFNGNASAQCNLGALYAQGMGGLPQDFAEALRWYRSSAEQGNADGQHNLALMYAQGLGGLAADTGQSRRWCQMAAAKGHAKAKALLETLPAAAAQEHKPSSGPAQVRAAVEPAGRAAGAGSALPAHLPPDPRPRAIKAVEAADFSATELAGMCCDLSEPLLLRGAAQVLEDAVGILLAAAGQECCRWEVQHRDGAPEQADGSLQSMVDHAKHAAAGAHPAVMLVDGEFAGCTDGATGLGGSGCFASLGPGAQTPPCLAAFDLTGHLPEELRAAHERWLVVSSLGARCRLHRDPPWLSWHALLAGQQRWRLMPPSALPEAAGEAVGACGAEASGLDASACAGANEALQDAGDVLLVPPGWWRQSACEQGPSVSVTSQVLDTPAFALMLQSLHRAAGVTARRSTGCAVVDAQLAAEALVGLCIERPDRRAMLFTTRHDAPVRSVVRRPCTDAEVVD